MGTVANMYILHGWTYSTDKWQPFLDLLKQQGIDPVMLHVPGLTADSKEVWDLPEYVEWLQQATSGEKEPFILMGHSNGGRIGMAFAAQYPERLKHLILLDSAGIYHNEPLLRLKRLLFGRIAKAGKKLTTSKALRAALYKIARAQDYHQAPPNMRATMVNLHEADKQLPIEKVSVPTTIIWGRDDKVTPLSDGQELEKRIAHSRLHVIENGRHTPVFTHPDDVCRIVDEVLS